MIWYYSFARYQTKIPELLLVIYINATENMATMYSFISEATLSGLSQDTHRAFKILMFYQASAVVYYW